MYYNAFMRSFTLSIVVPAKNEAENIKVLYQRLTKSLTGQDFELLVINDGSTDATAQTVSRLAKKDKKVKLINLSRNFGHQKALAAGYKYASGRAIVTIDADLQDPPEIIPKMIEKWQQGAKIVYGKRRSRKIDTRFKKTSAALFYKLINWLGDTEVPVQVGDFRLLDREVVKILNKMPEHSKFWRGLTGWIGFRTDYVDYDRAERGAGETNYPLTKMIALAWDAVTSFSTKPLKMTTYIGLATAGIGLMGIVYALARRLFFPPEYYVTGWTALFIAVLALGGVQLISLGIIGEYLSRIYEEAQNRPDYIVKSTVNC